MARLRRYHPRPNSSFAEEPARPARARLAAAGLAIVFAFAGSVASISDVRAQDRVVRRFDREADLAPTEVQTLAQDSTGFLWVGTWVGLYRYDGVTATRWIPEVLNDRIWSLAASPDGRLLVVNGSTPYEIIGDRARSITRDDGQPFTGALAVAFATDGTAFMLAEDGLWRETSGGRWIVANPEHAGSGFRRVLRPNDLGGVDFATTDGLWSIHTGAPPVHVASRTGIADVVSLDGGRRIVLAGEDLSVAALRVKSYASLLEVDSGEVTELLRLRARGIELARRGDVVWASFDRFLVALRPGADPEVIGPDDGLDSGGAVLVDREGVLWLAMHNGLRYYPEPETLVWTEKHGLPSRHARFLARTDEAIWTTTWQGTGVIRESATGWNAETVDAFYSRSPMHIDHRDVLWVASPGKLHELRQGRRLQSHPVEGWTHSTWQGEGGPQWWAMSNGLFRVGPVSRALEPVTDLPFTPGQPIHAVVEDRAGRFWVASASEVCRAPGPPLPGADVSWWCEPNPAAPSIIKAMIALPSGAVWAASSHGGVICSDGTGWTPMPGNARLASHVILNLRPSRAGGVWILGHGVAQRVVERGGACGGWETLESLSAWHGVPAGGKEDILEQEDGTLWLAGISGIVQVPPAARFAEQRPPTVVVVDGRVDNESVSAPLRLPHHRNRLELQFAALSFRNPDLIRYQIRLAGDSAWTDARTAPAFRWVDLSPGTYQAEVRASLDGESWSAEPAAFEFEVMAPWYRQAWAFAAFALLAIALPAIAYRARIGMLLGLERQRTTLAMDLHDEVGSGLASIAILSELAANGAGDDVERKTLVSEISTTSQDLSSALSDLVWSLDQRPSTLKDLADRLADHGARLFSNGCTRFNVRLPESWPSTPVAFPVRRGVLLIGLEALHNAARHSGAHAVTFSLEREGTSWLLTVEDDGVGFPDGVLDRCDDARGLGLKSMRERARRIGAEIEWRSAPDRGATILVRFDLRGRQGRRVRLASLSAKASRR